MKAIDIFKNFAVYNNILQDIQQQELPELRKKKGFVKLSKSVSNQYTFLYLELRTVIKNEKNEIDNELYCKITFELKESKMELTEVYCQENSRKTAMEKIIDHNLRANNNKWIIEHTDKIFIDKNVTNYLLVSDSIAEQAYNCASGDDYWPGYYNKVLMDDERIELSQVNRMNSRSLDHKDDYSMRDLVFTIPLNGLTKVTYLYDYEIGDMKINFYDGSSKNNKTCGEKIIKKILEIQASFGKK